MEALGNTAEHCLRALCREVERLSEGMRMEDSTRDPEGGMRLAPLKVYEHFAPVARQEPSEGAWEGTTDHSVRQEGDPLLYAPWCCVQVLSWKRSQGDLRRVVKFRLMFGVHDLGEGNNAHRGLLSLMERVEARFAANPVLASQYVNDGEFDCAIAEQELYPYAFGTLVTGFEVAGAWRERSAYD